MTLGWGWRASRHVANGFAMRSKFVLAALREPSLARQLRETDGKTSLGALIAEWPQTLGYLFWPYQCAQWDARTRFERIAGHLAVIDRINGLKLSPDEKLVLADLSSLSEGTALMIDRPPWLAREGHLTLSLFKGDFRAFTVSFSLFGLPQTELFIGGLQGRQTDDILALYREFTKEFHGMRPRDFILEVLRMLAIRMGVSHIYAVADTCKISTHPYFRNLRTSGISYDEVWADRSGVRVTETYFELPLAGARRSLDDVPAKKRSMYRRRYEMLNDVWSNIPVDLSQSERRHFEAS